MKTAIMTDTNSGITEMLAETLGIFVLPMPVIIDDKTYYESHDLTEKDFFSALTGGRRVSTSQPSPGDVLSMWEDILSQGYDQVVYIPMSSGLSHSCEAAMGLAQEYEGRVFVADNHRISVTLYESVLQAKVLADAGQTGEAIKRILEADARRSSIYISVNTLDFLKKGGRITPAAAMLGSILNIKPILTIQGERLDSFAKARSMKKCEARMIEALKEDLAVRFADIPGHMLRIGAAGAGLPVEEQVRWTEALREAFPQADTYYIPLSASISCHTGPGAVGVGMSFRE